MADNKPKILIPISIKDESPTKKGQYIIQVDGMESKFLQYFDGENWPNIASMHKIDYWYKEQPVHIDITEEELNQSIETILFSAYLVGKESISSGTAFKAWFNRNNILTSVKSLFSK